MSAAETIAGPARTAPVAGSLPQRWPLLALLVSGTFFAYFHRSALSIAAPFISRDFHLDHAATGVLLSVFFWSYALAQIPSGWLADRFGVGRVYAIGFTLWAIAAGLAGLTSTFAALALTRLLLGIGQGIVFPGSGRAVANWFRGEERGGATAAYLSGVRIGQAAITALGASFIAGHGWRSFLVLTAFAGIVWIVPWVLFHWRYERTPIAREVAVRPSITRADFLRLLRDRRMVAVLVAFFAVDYVWLLYTTWIPGYFLAERRFSADEMKTFVALPLLLAAVAAVLAGIGSDAVVRAGRSEQAARKWFLVTGMLGASVIGAVGAVHGGHLAGILTVVSVIGLSVASTNSWALTQAVAGRERAGIACGAQNLVGNIGGIIAPIVTGFVARSTGTFVLPFMIAAALLVVAAMGTLALLGESRTPAILPTAG